MTRISSREGRGRQALGWVVTHGGLTHPGATRHPSKEGIFLGAVTPPLPGLLNYSDSGDFLVFTISSSIRAPYSMDSS